YDAANKKLYVVNSYAGKVDILDIANPTAIKKIGEMSAAAYGSAVTSVAVHGDMVALAVVKGQDSGKAVFFDLSGVEKGAVDVGANPDMLTFSPDGRYVVVANEGEPSPDYSNDPVGSVSVIRVSDMSVQTVGFDHLTKADLPEGMRIGHPTATVAQDVEPEYVAISADSKTAWVTLQENNAIAVIDIASANLTKLIGLGYKDWSKLALDPSNKDDGIHFGKWPVWGMYQPDSIAAYQTGGKTYLVTANEGDARDYDGFSEEKRAGKVEWDAEKWPNADVLKEKTQLGRLKISTLSSDTDGDGDMDKLMAYGARSFSIWSEDGTQVFDSGNAFELITAKRLKGNFNSDNDEGDSGDSRSDDKGPEPEGVTTGKIGDKIYAFIGLERVGGVMVYDVTTPKYSKFVGYVNNRNFDGEPKEGTAGDLGPEGLAFISAAKSPTGEPILAVANEVSGTVSLFEIQVK
ncbi:MAG: choice-of-anchor I family protein, partial [Parvibaculaceae bacterium]|nr:choice-of-anchor I family protein [Parvibaculaceae bacterium]